MIKKFLKYIGLNTLGMIGISCYILVDTLFISQKLGSIGLASLNFAIAIYTIINGLGLMLGIGGATKFSVEKETSKNTSPTFTHTVFIGMLFALVLLMSGVFFSNEISTLLGADAKTLEYTSIYIKMILIFSPFYILNNIVLAFVRNDSSPQLSMCAMLTSSFSNIILDYVFMYVMQMEMFGAVLATCFSPIISLLILSFHFIKQKNSFFICRCKVNLRIILKILSYGFSAFVGELASSVSLIVFNLVLVGNYGNIAVASYGIIANIALVCTAVATGIAQGTQPLVSSYYGRGDTKQLSSLTRYAILTSALVSIGIYLILFVFTNEIVLVFSGNDVALHNMSVTGTKLYFIGFLFASVNIVVTAILSASLRYKRSMVISLLRSCLLLIPTVLLSQIIGGIIGIWLAYPITEFIVLIITLLSITRTQK